MMISKGAIGMDNTMVGLKRVSIDKLKGKTFDSIERIQDNEFKFTLDDGSLYTMKHLKIGDEKVVISSVVGELDNMICREIVNVYGNYTERDVRTPRGEYRALSIKFGFEAVDGNVLEINWLGNPSSNFCADIYDAITCMDVSIYEE